MTLQKEEDRGEEEEGGGMEKKEDDDQPRGVWLGQAAGIAGRHSWRTGGLCTSGRPCYTWLGDKSVLRQSRTATATHNVAKENVTNQEAKKETHTLLPVRPALDLEETSRGV